MYKIMIKTETRTCENLFLTNLPEKAAKKDIRAIIMAVQKLDQLSMFQILLLRETKSTIEKIKILNIMLPNIFPIAIP